MEQQSIGDRLRNLRVQKGVNQDQAAEACGMSRIALARYETGTRVPRAEMVSRLADYYDVSVDYLLGRDDVSEQAERKEAPADERAEAKRVLETLSDEKYQDALKYLKYLQSQK